MRFDIKVNKCSSMEEIDKSLPTLIIGLQNAKKYISNFSILQKEYKGQRLWWTFSKTERMTDYLCDIQLFYNTAIKCIVENTEYEYVDCLECSFKRVKSILNYLLNNSDEKISFIDNKGSFLFLYSKKYNKIWGFSLSTMCFYGIKEKTINRLIKEIKNNEQIKDFSNIPYKVKRIIGAKLHYSIVLYRYF